MIEFFKTNWPVLLPVAVLIIDAIVKWTQTNKDDSIWERIRAMLPLDPKQPKK